MKKSNKITNQLLAWAMVLAMVVCLLPIQAVKAEESSQFNPDSIAWVPLTEYVSVTANSGFESEQGTIYYAILNGEYYCKLADGSKLKTKGFMQPLTYENPLGKDPYGVTFYTYLKFNNGTVSLIEGACTGQQISFECGGTKYHMQSVGNSTLAKATDSYYQLIVPSGVSASYGYTKADGTTGRIPAVDDTYLTAGTYFIGTDPTTPSGMYTTPWNQEKAYTRKPNLSNAAKEATDAIDAATNLTDAQKEAAKDIIAKLKTDGDKIITDAISKVELDRATVDYAKGMKAIADIAKTASDTNKAIDATPGLTDDEKAESKKKADSTLKDASDAIPKAEDTKTIDDIVAKAKNSLDSIIPNAELDKKAKEAKDAIDKMPALSDAEKKAAKDAVDKALTDAKTKVEAAATADDKTKAKEDGLKAIDAEKNNAQKKSDENATKAQTDANKFIDDLLKDENGEIIKTVNEVTIIKIIESIEHWNTLDQTTKDYINQILLEKIGKTYEQLVEEAKAFAAATDQKLNDDFDSGSLIAKVKKTNTKSTTLSWTKVKGADGYIIYSNFCNTNEKKNKFKKIKDVKGGNKTSCKITKRKKNKWYKYRVVAYKTVDGKQLVLGQSLVLHACNANKSFKYANPTGVKVKKASFSLAAGKTATIKANLVIPKGKKYKPHTTCKVRYIVSNKDIATVSNKGKITAKKAGTCYIYACAQNGVYKKIKVTVK